MSRIPLVLLPGLICDRELWRDQITGLADLAEIEVADLTNADSFAEMAERVLARAPARFALAALSMGGYLAFEIMRRAATRVERLALLDTSARADTPEQLRKRRMFVAHAKRGKFKGVTPQLITNWVSPKSIARDAGLSQRVHEMTLRVGADNFCRQVNAIMERPDSRPLLSEIACPTLVLCGREDEATPLALSQEMAADIPDAQLRVLDECGHLSPMEKPEAVNDAMRRWLMA
ncbi:MAG: alpha/beta fold hydrolase [Alphaproteobacteria bacterium]|nr:alpha/beta fold hydrolase [Alphaproteobacteria bacterium]